MSISNPTNPRISIHLDSPHNSSPTFSPGGSPSMNTYAPPGSPTIATTPVPRRKDRSALRHFYGLGNKTQVSSTGTNAQEEPISELDKEGFDGEKYAEELCAKGDLRELLKVENELMNDIRGFDGERKALVYDNYSKLISATDTIKKMRTNMEPLMPTTSTLEPAVAHIAEISAALASTIHTNSLETDTSQKSPLEIKKETVLWVLDAPSRIEIMMRQGKTDEARKEWDSEILPVLRKLKERGAKGVDELMERGGKAFAVNSIG